MNKIMLGLFLAVTCTGCQLHMKADAETDVEIEQPFQEESAPSYTPNLA